MSAVKVIIVPSGQAVTLGAYVQAWKAVKAAAPGTEFKGWDHFPQTREAILADLSRGVTDRINLRGKVNLACPRGNVLGRILRKLDSLVKGGHLKCECRWCGQPLGRYEQKHARFCGEGCRRSFWS